MITKNNTLSDIKNQSNKDFVQMIEASIKAPSGHNTQPWKFKILEHGIEIHPNFEKSLPAVDPDNRELFISLGCAVENLCVAAAALGYSADMIINKNESVSIGLIKNGDILENNLSKQINIRQSNKNVYNKINIPTDTINQLKKMENDNNIHFYLFANGEPYFKILQQQILAGNTIQMNDSNFKKELISWIRFNNCQVLKTQDGLSYKVMGKPAAPTFLGKMIIKFFLKADKQNKTDLEKITSSSHFVLFTTKNNSKEEWILLGRTVERFLLYATSLGIVNAYMNQPCEIAHLAKELQLQLPVNNEFPTILIRIGYAEPLPYSPRKSIEQFLLY